MKQLLFALMLSVATTMQAQKILSHTTTLGQFANNQIDCTERSDGSKYYTVYLSSTDQKVIGTKIIETNKERVSMIFETKEEILKCLQYLYDFNKGDGYFISLENKSGNCVLSYKKGFIFGGENDINKPFISQWTIGKLLNSIGVSVVKKDDRTNNTGDDMYKKSNPLF